MTDGWLIGWTIGAGVVVIVVALLSILILSARRIGGQVSRIRGGLERLERNTRSLWGISEVSSALRQVTSELAAPTASQADEDRR